MDRDLRLRRLRFRAWHRGTREADYMIGGYFDTFHAGWDDGAVSWFEALVEEDDVDIMAWMLGTLPVPERFAGPHADRMRTLDFIRV